MEPKEAENTPLVLHSDEVQSYTSNVSVSKVADSVQVDIPSLKKSKTSHTNLDELPPDFHKDGPGFIKGCKQSPHLLSWFLSIISLIFLVLLIWYLIHYQWFWYIFLIFFIFFWCIYTVEWRWSSSMSYLENIYDKDSAYNYIKDMHSVKPTIKWSSTSYHYEEREVRRSNGEYTTKQVKKVTHRASTQYLFTHWKDISVPCTGLEEWKLTKLRLYKQFSFDNDDSSRHYNRKLNKWLSENHKDIFQESHVVMHLQGFKGKCLVESSPGSKSKHIDSNDFVIISCFGCSPCYKWYLSAQTGTKPYTIQKEIGI